MCMFWLLQQCVFIDSPLKEFATAGVGWLQGEAGRREMGDNEGSSADAVLQADGAMRC